MKNIYLTGMMGCGKTAIGKRFARAAKRRFVDTDELVAARSGITISDIFEKYGEAEFRAKESEALFDAAQMEGAVVSCGGGIVLNLENVRVMRQTGRVVYIKRDIEDIIATVNTGTRPLLRDDGSNIRALFEKRRDIYEGACDVVLLNDGSLKLAVERLCAIAEDMGEG